VANRQWLDRSLNTSFKKGEENEASGTRKEVNVSPNTKARRGSEVEEGLLKKF